MAGTARQKAAPSVATLTDPVDGMMDLTTSVNRISSNSRDVNPYEIRNGILIEEAKERVRYQNGKTVLPASAQQLFANAQRRDYNHRRTLSRNIVADAIAPRPANACAHHIVALKHEDAELARRRLFGWSIGINDADNGVFLPRWANKPLASHPNAPQHEPVHSPLYFSTVYARLRSAEAKDSEAGRARLKTIKAQLQAGSFPW